MSDENLPALTRMEQIQVLMAEYNTLRTEILQRNTAAFQIFGVAGTAAVGISVLVAAYSAIILGFLLFCVLLLIIFILQKYFQFDTAEAAGRLIEVERHINLIAGVKLLVWETEHSVLSEAHTRRSEHILGPFRRAYYRCIDKLLGRFGSN